MCPPSDAACCYSSDRSDSGQKLKQKPISQNDEGWNRDEKYEDKGQDSSSRIKNDIGTHHAGDGAAGAERWKGGVVIKNNVRETGTDAASEVEKKIGDVAEVIFHVVSENPEEEHVPGDVHEAAMHEHAGENGQQCGFQAAVSVESQADVIGDGGVGQLEGLLLAVREREFVKKDDDVRQNEKGIDDRIGLPWVQVFERDEHSLACWCKAPF